MLNTDVNVIRCLCSKRFQVIMTLDTDICSIKDFILEKKSVIYLIGRS